MRRAGRFVSAVMIFAGIGCGGSSAPTSPARSAVGSPAPTITVSAAPALSVFGASVVDFARCLQGAGDAACLSGPRITLHAMVGAAATTPASPLGLSTSSSGSSVMLTWSAPASGDAATSYVIEAGSAPGLANLANFVTGSTATSFSAGGVGNGTYYVRVRAQNTAGTSAASNESTLIVASTACTNAPNAPIGLTITTSGNTVTLTWIAAGGGCAPSSYLLEAGSTAGSSNLANSNVGNTTSYVATGVGSGTYYVRVRATNAFGQSGGSNEFTLTVGGGPPPTPMPGTAVRWLGVSPDGMTAEPGPRRCPEAFDLQLDLTMSGTTVIGSATTRLRQTSSQPACQALLGFTATYAVYNGRIDSGAISFDLGGTAAVHFSGTYTSTRMTGTFLIAAETQPGVFSVNRQ